MKKIVCARCGARFDPAKGKCPDCGASVRAKELEARREVAKDRQEKKMVASGFAVAAVALLALLTVVLCGVGGVFNFVGGSAPVMPRVVGQTESNARMLLEELGVRVESKPEASAEAAGVVTWQSVAEGRVLKAQQTVTLKVSDGSKAERVPGAEDTGLSEETVEAPYVLNEDFESVRTRVESMGLYLTYGEEVYSEHPAGTILQQEPAAGTPVRRGSAVSVTVSLGPEKTEYSISVTAGKGGSVSPGGRVTVEEGQDVEFVITPDEGYVLRELKVDGEGVGTPERYTFTAVDADHTFYAVFWPAETALPEDEELPPYMVSPSDIPEGAAE